MLTLMHTIVIEHYLRIIGEFYNVCGNFTWRVSDCEELVGEVNHTTECVTDLLMIIDLEWTIL